MKATHLGDHLMFVMVRIARTGIRSTGGLEQYGWVGRSEVVQRVVYAAKRWCSPIKEPLLHDVLQTCE